MLRQLQEMRSLLEVVSLRRGRRWWKQCMQYVVRPESRLVTNHFVLLYVADEPTTLEIIIVSFVCAYCPLLQYV